MIAYGLLKFMHWADTASEIREDVTQEIFVIMNLYLEKASISPPPFLDEVSLQRFLSKIRECECSVYVS